MDRDWDRAGASVVTVVLTCGWLLPCSVGWKKSMDHFPGYPLPPDWLDCPGCKQRMTLLKRPRSQLSLDSLNIN